MGKPYARELDALSDIYDWAKSTPVDQLSEFVKDSAKIPLYVIGSGGSFSAAVFASRLHQHIGMIAQPLTPLEFLNYENIDSNCSILIVTAGGNNTDILSSFDKAVQLKPKNLGILCASTGNKLTRRASKEDNVITHAIKLPTGKDGFLATNSLLATLVWLCRAYIAAHSLPYMIPSVDRLVLGKKTQHEFEEIINSKLEGLRDKETLICIHDSWGKTAAIDAESKLIEAGLIGVQLSDYRNFAHGRHNWLDKNKETGLVSFVNPQCEQLSLKTLRLIPSYVPVASLTTNHDGPIASLALIIQVLYLVKFFGTIRGIDPGRPGVAAFGRKIYHLSMPRNNPSTLTNFEKLALRRKFGHASMADRDTKVRLGHFKRFIDRISKQRFKAVVFDYDGTICDIEHRSTQPSKEIGNLIANLLQHGIVIGIATGRGKSVRNALQRTILKTYWSKISIGYYNCGYIGDLGDASKPDKSEQVDAHLHEFLTVLQDKKIIPKNHILEVRPKQISIQSDKPVAKDLLHNIQKLAKDSENVRIVESGHSIDMLPSYVSKLNLIDHIRAKIPSPSQILCIGDMGDPPGNDSELLDREFSLSVDTTTQNPANCWNLLPEPLHGEKGVLEYFKHAELNDKFFTLNIKVIK